MKNLFLVSEFKFSLFTISLEMAIKEELYLEAQKMIIDQYYDNRPRVVEFVGRQTVANCLRYERKKARE